MMPQVISIRAIHRRAPTLARRRLLGISNRKYPTKKIPLPRPNIAAEKPNALFIVNAAKPTLTLSRYAVK
jgi:hypothetical protein